jgi:hypothetical protein
MIERSCGAAAPTVDPPWSIASVPNIPPQPSPACSRQASTHLPQPSNPGGANFRPSHAKQCRRVGYIDRAGDALRAKRAASRPGPRSLPVGASRNRGQLTMRKPIILTAGDPLGRYTPRIICEGVWADEPCEVCGSHPDDCICQTCSVCEAFGDPFCYDKHGLVRSAFQIASLADIPMPRGVGPLSRRWPSTMPSELRPREPCGVKSLHGR